MGVPETSGASNTGRLTRFVACRSRRTREHPREHVDTHGVEGEHRLFQSGRAGPLQETAYAKVWRTARQVALTPAEAASPLVRRPYDLRHACASLMLNAGVPATEAARDSGHSVAILLKRYANCIDGQELAADDRIARALEDGGV